ncbi:uncharacterized protein LOC144634314 isoform X3 [Oculina patagonica]
MDETRRGKANSVHSSVFSFWSSKQTVKLFPWKSTAVEPLAFTSVLLTNPSGPGNTLITRPMGHWFLGTLSSAIRTNSPTAKFLCVLCHFWRSCKEGMYSLSQRFQ